MRPLLSTLIIAFFTTTAFAQTKEHKIGISVGGGTQVYMGDLMNRFELDNDLCRWATVLNARYYLNSSFDAGIFGSIGDYGYCQPGEVASEPTGSAQQCPGCGERVGLNNLSARIFTAGISFRYKIANGYLLKADSRFRPYVYAGAALNKATDVMKMNCVKTGNYSSVNAGVGVQYYINERVNIGYNLGFGYFLKDDMDFMSHGGNDMSRQNTLSVGIDLF